MELRAPGVEAKDGVVLREAKAQGAGTPVTVPAYAATVFALTPSPRKGGGPGR